MSASPPAPETQPDSPSAGDLHGEPPPTEPPPDEELSRRGLLKLGAAAGAGLAGAGLLRATGVIGPRSASTPPAPRSRGHLPFEGAIVGEDDRTGHLLRDGGLTGRAPAKTERHDVVIVGAGIAGIAAAWRLRRELPDARICLLDIGDRAGGNARWGESEVSAYPWGAHYVRTPTAEAPAVTALLEEVGVIRGRDADGRPDFDTRALCHAPVERVFDDGLWTRGLFPERSATAADREQLAAFDREVAALARWRDADGRRAFSLPLHKSSRDPSMIALDAVSFADWLDERGLTAPALRWLLEYGCRDDYGTTLRTTSAWAGLHYHAAREDEEHEDRPELILRWPEGNGRLARLMLERAAVDLRTRHVAYRLEPDAGDRTAAVHALDVGGGGTLRLVAPHVVFAGPRYVLARLLDAPPPGTEAFTYAPWMVANVTLAQPPGGAGAPLAWDNVLRDSPSLGYVVATHGRAPDVGPTVITYYLPLAGDDPAAERRRLLQGAWADWAELCVGDLEQAHPGIADDVLRLDVWRWGHAMVRPVPGFIWGPARAAAAAPIGRIRTAHSDQAGLSLFEEALYQGVATAEEILAELGRKVVSLQ